MACGDRCFSPINLHIHTDVQTIVYFILNITFILSVDSATLQNPLSRSLHIYHIYGFQLISVHGDAVKLFIFKQLIIHAELYTMYSMDRCRPAVHTEFACFRCTDHVAPIVAEWMYHRST